MALTDTFVKNVKHTGASAGDKHTEGRVMYLLVNAGGKCWRMRSIFALLGLADRGWQEAIASIAVAVRNVP